MFAVNKSTSLLFSPQTFADSHPPNINDPLETMGSFGKHFHIIGNINMGSLILVMGNIDWEHKYFYIMGC